MARPPNPLGLPDWLRDILDQVAVNPVMTSVPAAAVASTVPRVAGKSLADRLGEILSPEVDRRNTGLPARMRLTTYDPAAGTAQLTGMAKGEPIATSIADLDAAMQAGHIAPELPPGASESRTIPQMQRRLRLILGAK